MKVRVSSSVALTLMFALGIQIDVIAGEVVYDARASKDTVKSLVKDLARRSAGVNTETKWDLPYYPAGTLTDPSAQKQCRMDFRTGDGAFQRAQILRRYGSSGSKYQTK